MGNDEEEMHFWVDSWVEGIVLRDRFRRLYNLASDKNITVVNIFGGKVVGGMIFNWGGVGSC